MMKIYVARTYLSWEKIGEPFIENKKSYIYVKNPKTKKEKKVRVYTEKEFNKLYPELKEKTRSKFYKTQKEVLGFSKGYITIFAGDTQKYRDWFKDNKGSCTRLWNWYFKSEVEIPKTIPEDLTPIILYWDEVGANDELLKPDEYIIPIVKNKILEVNKTEYYAEPGEKVEIDVVISNIKIFSSRFGPTTMFIMKEKSTNYTFIWFTTSYKKWEKGQGKVIKATVKKNQIFRNEPQTILTRCREIERSK